MKAIIEILEKNEKFELENVEIGFYKKYERVKEANGFTESVATGRPVVFITSNMSEGLKKSINKLIAQYYGM
jgi:hypothetical protein